MQNIIDYLQRTYNPVGLILYGSYCDGTQNDQSDFDALVLIRCGSYIHDTSVIDDVWLDVFVYPLDSKLRPEDFVQIYDGKVLMDETGMAGELLLQVRQYVDDSPEKTVEEKEELKCWCEKMLCRACRDDAEGQYRAHWVLTDSLQIYCDVRDRFYFGPKKTIARMQQDDPEGFSLFCDAMKDRNYLKCWIRHVLRINKGV